MAKNKKPAKKAAAKPVAKKAPAAGKPAPGKSADESKSASALKAARDDLRSRILGRKASKPIAFSLDEVREIAKTNAGKPSESAVRAGKAAVKAAGGARTVEDRAAAKPSHVKAASLVDVLGFNPKKTQKSIEIDIEKVPEKFRRYLRLLLDLRSHLLGQLDQHTEETLKRSTKEDTGDLSSYGQHMADAGTDTFDRDFALSMVANEQEALSEIEAAIQRIHDGTYGICEVTGKPISKERLIAVPFTRYSAEAQKEIEKNRYRARTQAGLFGELGEEGAKLSDSEGGGGDE
ncbi:MAG TPA: TraR/DksA C4-type zinc finger protein [Opitutaceae bacterium]|nr:TraR/DksA C4-type zinc finger protein [Opitutaceae bacterium]